MLPEILATGIEQAWLFWVYDIWSPFITGIWYFFVTTQDKVSCFSWILGIQFVDMNKMFIFQSKRLFAQGSILQF